MDEITVYDTKSAKRAYSRVGFAMLTYTAVFTVFQVVFVLVGNSIWGTDALAQSGIWKWVVSFVPQYVLALPCAVLVMLTGPAKAPEKTKLPIPKLLSFIPMAYAFTYAGSIIGNFLAMIISGGKATNVVTDYVNDGSMFLKILFLVLIGPLVEEFLCRKLVIDRIAQYGERTAVILSATLFALFHTNVYQVFYALGMGFILGYVYIRTGRLRYSYTLHAFFNLMGGIVMPFVLSKATALTENVNTEQMTIDALVPTLLGALAVLAVSSLVLGVVVFGIVLLVKNFKNTKWNTAEEEVPDVLAMETAFLNVGVIVFSVITILLTIYSVMV